MNTAIWRAGLVALLMVGGSAHAVDDPVPPDTDLQALPEGARLMAVRDIVIDNNGDGKHDTYAVDLGNGWFSELREEPFRVRKGTVYRIRKVSEDGALYLRPIGYTLPNSGDNPGDAQVTFKNTKHARNAKKTVRDLNNVIAGNLKIVFDDPLSGMDPAIAQDILLAKIMASIKDGKYSEALPSFERLEKLKSDLPESFFFHYIQALDKGGKKQEARARAVAYLKKHGKAGQYYDQVVELMSR
ncbi:hypothetical protein [Variovorax sp. 770b2]|uniref:hypothetical protein n=1 Tax=Variovorax sp. 770b2 TaxID=1566271 RepID=UPI0008E3EDC2|nr:hypothetical protein [Variovorax sp. 770b2]SFQ34402.1 hypothetical protein SAMN03159339_6869 [Variovorax sp. 770b2]